MKKFIILLTAAVLSVAQVSAQGFLKKMTERLYGGPKVEANASNFILSDMTGVKSKINAGVSAGGFFGLRLSEHFSVQEDILFLYQTSQLEQGVSKADFSYIGAELSLYGVGNWQVGNGRILAGIGPFVGYGIDAKYKIGDNETNLYEKDSNGDRPFQPFNIGAAVMLGYEFKCGLQINTSYKVGVMNQLDAGKSDASMLPSTVSVGVAYRFGK